MKSFVSGISIRLTLGAALVALVCMPSLQGSEAHADRPAVPMEKKKKAEVDYVRVLGSHTKANPKDPVVVSFTKFSLRNVKFNPRKIVGSKAELVIDVNSMSSGIAKRDAHLKRKDLVDVEKRPEAVVSIVVKKRVKKTNVYEATAKVTLGGVSKTWKVKLEVLSSDKKLGTRFKVSHDFARSDFGVGGAGNAVADKLTAKAVLTIK